MHSADKLSARCCLGILTPRRWCGYYGDADFNGKVNFDDYARIDAGFNGHLSGWLNGDFDGNGKVNFDDYALIDQAINGQSGVLGRSPARPPTPALIPAPAFLHPGKLSV